MNGLTTEMADLLESLCLGELSPDEATRIEAMATNDEDFCRHYIRFVYMHALAERLEGIEVASESQPAPMTFSDPVVAVGDVAGTAEIPLFGAPVDARIGFFSAGWPVAYLVATVVFAIGLAIGAFVHVSQPVDVVKQPASPSSPPLPSSRSRRPDHPHDRLPLGGPVHGQHQRRVCSFGAQIRVVVRADGDYLRQRGQGRPARSGDL